MREPGEHLPYSREEVHALCVMWFVLGAGFVVVFVEASAWLHLK